MSNQSPIAIFPQKSKGYVIKNEVPTAPKVDYKYSQQEYPALKPKRKNGGNRSRRGGRRRQIRNRQPQHQGANHGL